MLNKNIYYKYPQRLRGVCGNTYAEVILPVLLDESNIQSVLTL